MSIAENYGGLYDNLALLRETNGEAENNFFKSLGFDYHFVKEGNNVEVLIEAFNTVKDVDHPVVLHIHTVKGKGYKDAEENKEAFHWVMPFNLETKEPLVKGNGKKTYAVLGEELLIEKAKADRRIIGITAATPGSVGLKNFRNVLKDQYLDVGIAEEHAVAMASAIAILGLGSFYHLGKKVKEKLKEEMGINATLINPRYITGLDKEMLEELTENHQVVITLEDGILNGGFGEKIASFYGNKDMKVLNFGAYKEFTNRVPLTELYERYHLTEELIINDIKAVLK